MRNHKRLSGLYSIPLCISNTLPHAWLIVGAHSSISKGGPSQELNKNLRTNICSSQLLPKSYQLFPDRPRRFLTWCNDQVPKVPQDNRQRAPLVCLSPRSDKAVQWSVVKRRKFISPFHSPLRGSKHRAACAWHQVEV